MLAVDGEILFPHKHMASYRLVHIKMNIYLEKSLKSILNILLQVTCKWLNFMKPLQRI